jgi:hypothetical protein
MTIQRSVDSEAWLGQVSSLAQQVRQADARARSLRRNLAPGAPGKNRLAVARAEQQLEQLVHQMAAVLRHAVEGRPGWAA